MDDFIVFMRALTSIACGRSILASLYGKYLYTSFINIGADFRELTFKLYVLDFDSRPLFSCSFPCFLVLVFSYSCLMILFWSDLEVL